jgi:hypothetical protein
VWTAAIAAVAAVVAIAPWAYRIALVGSSAEILCGGVFISGRDEAAVTSEDLSGPGYAPLHLFHKTIDLNEKRVTASLFGLAKQTAIFRDGLGCTLIGGRDEKALHRDAAGSLQSLPSADYTMDPRWAVPAIAEAWCYATISLSEGYLDRLHAEAIIGAIEAFTSSHLGR